MTICSHCHRVSSTTTGQCLHCGHKFNSPVNETPAAGPVTKRCPFCAEEILAAAIVCKHCHRDLALQPVAPPPAKKPSRALPLFVLLGFIGAIGFCGFYIWGNSAYSVSSEAALKAIQGIENEGGLRGRTCGPNQAVMPRGYWRSIPNERTRENLFNALSRLCIDRGSGPDFTLLDEQGSVIAEFNGWSFTSSVR